MARKILLTFNGNQDPLNKDGKPGPILTLLSHKQGSDEKIDVVYLFYTTNKKGDADRTAASIKEQFHIEVEFYPVKLDDPIDYRSLLNELRKYIPTLLGANPLPEYLIFLSPGTPQMHASWFMLAASGEIPAKLCQTRPPDAVCSEKGWHPVVFVDPEASWFPHILLSNPVPESVSFEEKELTDALESAGIVGSAETIKLFTGYVQAARYDSSIVIGGESGTGKELLARFIHILSDRKDKKFVAINCAALPETLIESELFGYVSGAFSGASSKGKDGLFKIADGGTLFLDEIADMSLSTQMKVLRAIQFGEIRPLGATAPTRVNVRIIAATNKNLLDLVEKKLFREDLYYRLNVVHIALPPLRERRGDIALLANYFQKNFNEKFKTKKYLTPRAIRKLENYAWRGNIRELKNVIERAFSMSEKTEMEIGAEKIVFDDLGGDDVASLRLPLLTAGFSLENHLKEYRDALYKKALEQANNNQNEAARLLGITAAAVTRWKKSTEVKIRGF